MICMSIGDGGGVLMMWEQLNDDVICEKRFDDYCVCECGKSENDWSG